MVCLGVVMVHLCVVVMIDAFDCSVRRADVCLLMTRRVSVLRRAEWRCIVLCRDVLYCVNACCVAVHCCSRR